MGNRCSVQAVCVLSHFEPLKFLCPPKYLNHTLHSQLRLYAFASWGCMRLCGFQGYGSCDNVVYEGGSDDLSDLPCQLSDSYEALRWQLARWRLTGESNRQSVCNSCLDPSPTHCLSQ